MSALIELHESCAGWGKPSVQPLNETVWQAWLVRNREQEQRRGAVRMRALKLVSIAALLAVAMFGSHLAPYAVVVRFTVATGATVLMFEAFHARCYASAVIFGVLSLLYNPIAPVFSFSGAWQSVLVVTSTLPFVASLVRRDVRRPNAKAGKLSKRTALV